MAAKEGHYIVANILNISYEGSPRVIELDSGLTNEEVGLADSVISIPSFKHFSSLNLAQAVNIVGYEIWKRSIEIESASPPPEW